MTAAFVSFLSQLPNALALAGAFLVAEFLVTWLAFDENPIARFLAQRLHNHVVCGRRLAVRADAKRRSRLRVLGISVFKIAWW